MADSGKGNTPAPATKKTPEGSGKKKNKPKKAKVSSDDGAPSPAPSSVPPSPRDQASAASASPSVASSEGATAKPKATPKQGHSEGAADKTKATSTPKQGHLEGAGDKTKTTPKPGNSDGAADKPKATPKQGGKEKVVGDTVKKEGVQQKKSDAEKQVQSQKAKAEAGKKPEGGEGETKSKAQLKAERRAKQEAQRAAKEAKKNEGAGGASAASSGTASAAAAVAAKKETVSDKSKSGGDAASAEKKPKKKSATSTAVRDETEEQMWARKEREMLGQSHKIDNSILNLGFQYFHHKIVGANARCMALLATLKEVIVKYRTPEEKELSRDLEKNFLNPCISYINYCRPLSTSMGNAIKHLKYHISHTPTDMSDEDAIARLQDVIDEYIQVNITKAAEAVAVYACNKIDDGDVILIYAASSLIGHVLKTAHKKGKKFRVIVVEGRPRTEGKSMLRNLVRCGIPCSYIYIGSASHAMSEATKVFLGAAAMFAIGDMHSRSGNSMIAALAKANNIPVLVCCETYKFTDKVQLHSGDSNLHARGKDLISIGHKPPVLSNWEEIGLGLLNVMYDVTGSKYITAVVTELGMLPCTSVPVVLRRLEDLYQA